MIISLNTTDNHVRMSLETKSTYQFQKGCVNIQH